MKYLAQLLTVTWGIGLSVFANSEDTPVHWSGEVMATVRVVVVDDTDSSPISGARVWIVTGAEAEALRLWRAHPEGIRLGDPVRGIGSRVLTGAAGEAIVHLLFEASGWKSSTEPDVRGEYSWGRIGEIEVSEFGYAPVAMRLEDLPALTEGERASREFRIEIRMKPKEERQPNQALQTTPMTRSVDEKTIEFGYPQRGV